MNLFVTGATGFVGSHLVRLALQNNHQVLALRRSVMSEPRVVLPVQPEWIVKGMEELTASDFAGVDMVIHLAAHTPNFPYDSLENCVYWNLSVPLRMFDQAVKGACGDLLLRAHVSSMGRVESATNLFRLVLRWNPPCLIQLLKRRVV